MKIQNITFLTEDQKSKLLAIYSQNPMGYAYSKGMIASSIVRKMLEDVLKTGFVRTGYYNGSGKWATAQDFTAAVSQILSDLQIAHEKGNDASKGGVSGNFIKLVK
jgi:hypothetical protein